MTTSERQSSSDDGMFEHAEKKWEMTVRLIQALNGTDNLRDLMQAVTALLRDWVGCEAIGIRLRDGDDYPYYEVSGFPASFIEKENRLCAFDPQGQIVRACENKPVLECLCGHILCGRFNATKTFFTAYGSFWTNSTSRLLANATEDDRKLVTRGRCIAMGYESLALIPLRAANQVFGLLQFNDRRPNLFNAERIALFERLADSISIALSQRLLSDSLRAASLYSRSLIEANLDPLVAISAEGKITDVNTATEKITGMGREKLIGSDFAGYFTAPEMARAGYQKVFEWGQVTDYPLAIRHISGVVTEVLFNASVFRNDRGEVLGAFAAARDITALKQAQMEKEKLEVQNRQLQKSESLSRMAGAIAHHFNNQLQVVMMNLDFAMRAYPSGKDPIENLGEAMLSARKAAEVSTLLLTYLGQTNVKHEPLDLAEACRQSLSLVRAIMPKEVILKADLPSPGPIVGASANQIQQVLTNLLTNAWEACRETRGSISLAVKTVSATYIPVSYRFPIDFQLEDKAYACLEVADSGCGIELQDVEKIFEPFFSSKFIGRGLGLSVVLGIVRGHSGVVTVESEPGRGSVFRVFLPMSIEAEAEKLLPEASIPAELWGGTVLVVDDEAALQKILASVLKHMGFTVLAAQDGVQAVEVFREHQDEIRLVICDLTMPRMDGWETLTALRQVKPGVPIILSSGYNEAHVMAGNHSELPQAFLSKPYDLKLLRTIISRTIR